MMKKTGILFGLVFTLTIFSGSTETFAAGNKHALLIAIQEYQGDDPLLPSLAGAVNDLQIVGKMLRTQFGFRPPEDFSILMDEEATHSGIEQAFQQLINKVQPGDFVYIHYSGHGSQTRDLNGDERSGKDQTWVPYGARTGQYEGKDDYDILDDELDVWLSALYDKTSQVVFVSDSCHSATVSRAQRAVSRAVLADTRPNPFGNSRAPQLRTHRGIQIGAARDIESATEFSPDNEKYYGVFTWFWVQAIQHARSGEIWNDVFKRAYTQVTARRSAFQHPQIAGERSRELLGGNFRAMEPTISITQVETDTVTLDAGLLAGVTEGSVYRLYRPDLPNSQTLSGLTITQVTPFESTGKADGAFAVGDAVKEESHVYHSQPIRVHLQADYPEGVDASLLASLRVVFEESSQPRALFPAYTLTDDPKQADLTLYILRPQSSNGNSLQDTSNDVLPTSFADRKPEIWVLSPEHHLLYGLRISFDENQPMLGMRELQDKLTRIARIRELTALHTPRNSELAVMVDVYPVESCPEGQKTCPIKALGSPVPWHTLQGRSFSRYEELSFVLHNMSQDHDYYCYLLNITPEGKIVAVSPDPFAPKEEALLHAGEPRDLGKTSNGFAWRLDTPGEETFKLIASRRPIDVSLLETGSSQQRGSQEGNFTPLERLLLNAAYGLRTQQHYSDETWATDQVSFEVQ